MKSFILCLFLGLLFSVQSWTAEKAIPEDLVHNAYVYQSQSMKFVQWMYIGFAPRMEDASRVKVVFSKASYTMRVTVELTKDDLAQYPRYLVSKANQIQEIISSENLDVYQWWRMELFKSQINSIRKKYDQTFGYSEKKYKQGLALLKSKFPTNVFDYPRVGSLGQDDVVAVAHFVYPITINKAGKNFPPSGVYNQHRNYFPVPKYNEAKWGSHDAYLKRKNQIIDSKVQERRTDHGRRVTKTINGRRVEVREVTDYIFSGFPAFWIYPSAQGVGVHGPIRFSKPTESRRSENRCENYPRRMKEFWSASEFVAAHEGYDMQKDLPSMRLRWDLVRTNNSAGCFRAEPMELRHILPVERENIYRHIYWSITDQLDKIQIPSTGEWKYVDVDYYILDHYRCPLSREEWVHDRIIRFNKGLRDPKTATEFIKNSIQFEYNDPATIEFALPRSQDNKRVMEKLNQTGLGRALQI